MTLTVTLALGAIIGVLLGLLGGGGSILAVLPARDWWCGGIRNVRYSRPLPSYAWAGQRRSGVIVHPAEVSHR